MSAKGPLSRVNFIKELSSHRLCYVTAKLLPQLFNGPVHSPQLILPHQLRKLISSAHASIGLPILSSCGFTLGICIRPSSDKYIEGFAVISDVRSCCFTARIAHPDSIAFAANQLV